jgi:hypothetical protein
MNLGRKLSGERDMDVQAFAIFWVAWLAVVLGLIAVVTSRC